MATKDTRELLKKIATDTAQRSGAGSVTLREIGAAVGIKSSSVMYHFQSKKGLIREITEDYISAVRQTLEGIRHREPEAPNRLRRLVELFEDLLRDEKMCLCGMLAGELHELDAATVERVRHFFAYLEDWVATVLIESREGEGAPEEALGQARVLVASLEGALLLDKAEGSTNRLAAVKAWWGDWLGA